MTKKYSKSDIDALKRDVFDLLKGPNRRYRPRHVPRKDAWAVVKVLEMLEEVRSEMPNEALPPSGEPVTDTMRQGARGRAYPYTGWPGNQED